MGLFKNFRLALAAKRLDEEALYEVVVEELAHGIRREGLWAKALVETEGDDLAANARYIKLRVQALIDEHTLAIAMSRTHAGSKKVPLESPTAAPAKRKAPNRTREQEIIELLAQSKYITSRHSGGWRIHEPLGGRVDLSTEDELIEYAKEKVSVPI